MLRDAAGLSLRDVGLSDVVEQSRLSVVDVPHYRDDGRTQRFALAPLFFLIAFLFRLFAGLRTRLRLLLNGFGLDSRGRRGLFRFLHLPFAEHEVFLERPAENFQRPFIRSCGGRHHQPSHHQRLYSASRPFAGERRHVGDGSAFAHIDDRISRCFLHSGLSRGLFFLFQETLHHWNKLLFYRTHMRFYFHI